MNLKISFSKEADRFLRKNAALITEADAEDAIIAAVKKILKLEDTNINVKKLKGKYRGYFRVRRGDVRIVFSLIKDSIVTVIVNDIDFRGNIYK
jgi:mRNA interferase RelE/StbE